MHAAARCWMLSEMAEACTLAVSCTHGGQGGHAPRCKRPETCAPVHKEGSPIPTLTLIHLLLHTRRHSAGFLHSSAWNETCWLPFATAPLLLIQKPLNCCETYRNTKQLQSKHVLRAQREGRGLPIPECNLPSYRQMIKT